MHSQSLTLIDRQRFAWIPVAIVFIIFLGLTADDFVNTPMGSGINEAGGILSFASTIWGCKHTIAASDLTGA